MYIGNTTDCGEHWQTGVTVESEENDRLTNKEAIDYINPFRLMIARYGRAVEIAIAILVLTAFLILSD